MKKIVYTLVGILFMCGSTKAQAPVLVKDIASGDWKSSFPEKLIDVNGTLFFVVSTEDGNEYVNALWKSDGTEAGTVLVKDINPTNGYENFQNMTNVNGTLFFTIDDGIHGMELWKSDGTSSGTVMVKDINTSNNLSSEPGPFTSIGSILYFTANDGVNGRELWKSDGTADGTSMVIDLTNSNYSSFLGGGYSMIANLNGILYFLADDYNGQRGLWKSDGTATGTSFVKAIDDYGAYIKNVNGTLYFNGSDAMFGGELWKSDGTTAGTMMIKDINPGSASSSSTSHNYSDGDLMVFSIGNTIYFEADSNGDYKRELWKTDGTASGTLLVKDFVAITGGKASYCTNLNNILYFGHVFGNKLYKSDGTETGTVVVKDFDQGVRYMVNYEDALYFNAYYSNYGQTLWRSDGTEAGTTPFTTNNFAGGRYLTVSNDKLYFVGSAKDGTGNNTGSELYYLDLNASSIGINEVQNEILDISPNPASHQFTLSGLSSNSTIQIINLNGQILLETFANQQSTNINTENLKSGTYIVHIINENQIVSKKLIVNK